MAKKHRTRPHTSKGHMKACAPTWDGQAMAYAPSDSPRKRNVAKAHRKHQTDHQFTSPSSTQPTLADRLYSLPQELRSHIFSFLLVQPVKWDISHEPDCLLRTINGDITPYGHNDYLCAEGVYSLTCWRRQSSEPDTWTSPWRSQWAPEQLNPYVCSTCYDESLRPKPFPQAKILPCLCARRENLQVLLVCRRWYLEAGLVFYTRNTFAFEDTTTFIDFVQNLPRLWRNRVSKLSLMIPLSEASDTVVVESARCESQIWSLLRGLPSLSSLEMDAAYLNDPKAVHAMMRMGLRNLRQCSFVERVPEGPKTTQGSEHVWPHFAGRTLIQGGFAGEVARAVKGQRQKRLKTKGVIEQTIEEMHKQAIIKALGRNAEE